ncbi:MAG: sulfotransferase [Gammaproteobacteria bacterium HGW-Gammaproteobacteria-14]|nr:MAG: sulfotransferase [Gammaproteobacteria bacterium HGW-Gammaproteobacteria-14]
MCSAMMYPTISLPRLFWRSFFPAADSAYRKPSLQRLLVLLLFWPVFLSLLLGNRLCLWLDTVLFPDFKKLAIDQPLFVVGVPRSGTTFLHRLLAMDEQRFTTTALWELVFAPSIVQRRFWIAAAALDRHLGRPCARLLHRLERSSLQGLDDIHKTGLLEPEEDYLALSAHLGCFLLILPFGDTSLWRLAYLDRDASDAEKKRLMQCYRSLIQRHLYVHGADKTFLSKNPSFTPWIKTLRQEFPDARFIGCIRTPHEALPSQVNSILIGAGIFSGKVDLDWWREGLRDMLAYYYETLVQSHKECPAETFQIAKMASLVQSPNATISALYDSFGWTLRSNYEAMLETAEQNAKQYRSGHHYEGEKLGVNADETEKIFNNAIAYFELGAKRGDQCDTLVAPSDQSN